MATSPPAAREPFDFAGGFRFAFEDPDWIKKILIGGLFSLLGAVLIGFVFVAGYALRLTQRTARREPRPMPEWDDLGGIFSDGLRAVVVYLGHAMVLLLPVGAIVMMIVMAASLSSGSHGRSSDAAAGLMGLGIVGIYAIAGIGSLLLAIYIPAPMTRLALGATVGAAFDPRENVAFIRRNIGNYALALVLYLLVSFLAQFGFVLCCIGVFPVSFWATCVLSWSMGEVARKDPSLAVPYAPLAPTV
jgi:uncharacterized protein DUF4013